MPRTSRSLATFSLSAAAVVVAVLLGEIGLRVLDVAHPAEFPPRPSGPEMFVADPVVGYHLWPSTRTCIRYPPGAHRLSHLVSNSDGFASSSELGEPDPRPRVLVLGDSFTFGIGVEEGARFTEVVEELEPRWRVDNLGMVGWGLDLMVRSLERYGPKAAPNAVVLAFYTDDFRRLDPRYAGIGYRYAKYTLRDGTLVDVASTRPALWRRLHLVELARAALQTRDQNYWELNEALVDRFNVLTRRLKASPAILFLPGRSDTAVDRERRRRLRQWAERRAIPFRDLTEPLHEPGVNETYLPDNWHWNERGHRIAGEALRSLLAADVLVDAGAHIDLRALPPPPWHRLPRNYCRDEHRDSPRPRAGQSGWPPLGTAGRDHHPAMAWR